MPAKKSSKKFRYITAALVAGAIAAVFFMYTEKNKISPPAFENHQTGYNEEDRQKLEQLIHKND